MVLGYNRPTMSKRDAKELCHWADKQAARIVREKGELPLYVCAAGITPSGTVHIGNFREIITVDLVARALQDAGHTVRFIYSWDDYDVFRKVPANMPQPELLARYLRQPITSVPDTTGEAESYARRNELDIERELPRVGIHPEFLYQAERYRSCRYAEGMRRALQNRAIIKECLNAGRDNEHKMAADEEYWPVSAFCASCGKDTTEITGYDGEWGISYKCTSCGHEEAGDLRTSPGFKLGWRVDWPMRWKHEQVVFEPGGKDHISPGGSYDTAKIVSKRVYGWDAPVTMKYDFVKIKGLPGKMSSSSGKVISLVDALLVYQSEVLRYIFAVNRPDHEFAISFDTDVITVYEAYDRCERIAWGMDAPKDEAAYLRERRVYELSQVEPGFPDTMPYQVPFRQMSTLVQIYSGDIDAALSSISGTSETQRGKLRQRAECAWYWVSQCAPEEFRFALRGEGERELLDERQLEAVRRVRDDVAAHIEDFASDKDCLKAMQDIATQLGLQSKELFCALYTALIGKTQGPRLASFMRIIGRERLMRILEAY